MFTGPQGGRYYLSGREGARTKPLTSEHQSKVNEIYKKISKEDRVIIGKSVKLWKQGKDTFNKNYKNNQWSEERLKVHDEIFTKYDDLARQAGKSDNPTVVFLAGLPASGKTYATKKFFKKQDEEGLLLADNDGNMFITLNADDLKAGLPEYNKGKGSSVVHKESSKLLDQMIHKYSGQGINIIIDGTMANQEKAKGHLDSAHKKGYSSKLYHVDVEIDFALDMALKRFKEEGRSVPFSLIPDYHPQIKDSVDNLKNSFDEYNRIRNELGKEPEIIETKSGNLFDFI